MTYTWNGPAGRGAMKIRRETKRSQAEARNAAADAGLYTCGHTHGAGRECAK